MSSQSPQNSGTDDIVCKPHQAAGPPPSLLTSVSCVTALPTVTCPESWLMSEVSKWEEGGWERDLEDSSQHSDLLQSSL